MAIEMKPGRELDALVAEKVMGCKVTKILDYGVSGNYRYRCDCNGPSPIGTPPHADPNSFDNDILDYSTDIAAAWTVVEKLRNDCEVHIVAGKNGYYASLYGHFEQIDGETAPHAICLAALKALGVELK